MQVNGPERGGNKDREGDRGGERNVHVHDNGKHGNFVTDETLFTNSTH